MEIVFVHFGPRLPKYLLLNLKRTCDLLPSSQITLIVDQVHQLELGRENFRIHLVRLNEEYSTLNLGLSHPKDFRNNFWFSSLARLVALADYVIANQSSVLHIESDVIISGDFPVDKFALLDRQFAYTLIGPQSAVASVMWIANQDAAVFLKNFIRASVAEDPNTTDMKILGKLQAQNPHLVRSLASFPVGATSAYSGLNSKITEDFLHSEQLFAGFFDAADIGQYLLGDDPRNHRGFKVLRRQLPSSYLKPRNLNYSYSSIREFLDIPMGENTSLYSLHIHSKNQKVFGVKSSRKCLQRGERDQRTPETSEFVVKIFLKAVTLSLLRRFKALKETLSK